MFSITVEEVLQKGTGKGITLIGKTSGLIKIGDYLAEVNDRRNHYKVIGVEMIHYIKPEKNITHNPAIMIEQDNCESLEFKGKTLVLQKNLK